MTTVKDPLLGSILSDRYRIDAVIARGGMAMVYRGTDLRLDRDIAIKVMHAHLAADEAFVERFEREAVNAAKLSHPNLVAIHDQGRDGDIVFLIMEYLESVTLRRELKHRGRLTPRHAIVVTNAVLAALEVVHAAGMIHRDLKPDNVLLGTDGQIKLTDFGLARAVTTATTTKTLIGTVGYVAPELVTRAGADARTDLYTIGIMLYEMLTGVQPYTDDVPIQVAYRHVHDRVPAPSEALEGLPPLIDALVLWATSPDPEERPHSAVALRQALSQARSELSDEQLDFGADNPTEVGAGATLTATADIDAQLQLAQSPQAAKAQAEKTDEIPYLDENDGEAEPVATAAAPASELSPSATKAEQVVETTEKPRTETDAHRSEPVEDAVAAAAAVKPVRRQAARKRLTLAVAAAVIIIMVIAGLALNNVQSSGPRAVPTVAAGVSQSDAEQAISTAGFTTAVVEDFSTEIPAGRVLEVQPTAGTELNPGDTVTITVSKGRDLVDVPKTDGMAEDEARTAVEKAGLKVGQVNTEYSESVAKGAVISQSLEAGSEADRGANINFVVSSGPEPITVPEVGGLDFDSAYGKLLNLGFRVGKDEIYHDSVPKGKVISQYPTRGAKRAPDSLILLRVSKGKKPQDDKPDENTDEAKQDGS